MSEGLRGTSASAARSRLLRRENAARARESLDDTSIEVEVEVEVEVVVEVEVEVARAR